MERVLSGGEMRDPGTGKWVKSKRELWRCVAAFEEAKRAERAALRVIAEQFAEHLRLVEVEGA